MTNPGNDSALHIVKKWLDICVGDHSSCRQMEFRRLPTRVIDVGTERLNNGTVKLLSETTHCARKRGNPIAS